MDEEPVDLDYEVDEETEDRSRSVSPDEEPRKVDPIAVPPRFPGCSRTVSPTELALEEQTRAAFGITKEKKTEVLHDEIEALFKDLNAGVLVNDQVTLVKGCDGLSNFDIERIFAEYKPTRVEQVDSATAFVSFSSRNDAAAMVLGMTKALRRVRAKKTADEDGEVLSSGDEEHEEGQLMQEHGDDVAVVDEHDNGVHRMKRTDVVEIDVNIVKVPDGRWRVVTKHVPEKRLLLVRYATYQEILDHRRSMRAAQVVGRESISSDGATEIEGYARKIRPGLNIFDDSGKELGWNFAHDTRYYDDKSLVLEEDKPVKEEDITSGAPQATKVKGRGAKMGRFLYGGGGGTLASDDADSVRAPKRNLNMDEERVEERRKNADSDDDDDHWPAKRWQSERFGRLGDRLQRD